MLLVQAMANGEQMQVMVAEQTLCRVPQLHDSS